MDASESVLLNEYSEKSDVWSFGVMIWELFSSAAMPLIHRTDDEVVMGQRTGENKLECPFECSPDLWKIAEMCMGMSAEQRPSFDEVVVKIGFQTSQV